MQLSAQRTTALIALAALLAILGACSSDDLSSPSPTKTEPRATTKPSPTQPPGPDTYELGEPIELNDFNITVHSVEPLDHIHDGYTTTVEPEDDESLWKVTMEFTNTSKEAVDPICFGPDSADVRLFDTQDRELLYSNESGFIPENDCENGLLTGQTGTFYSAYLGLSDSEPGYLTIDEYTGREVAVPLIDGLTIEYDD